MCLETCTCNLQGKYGKKNVHFQKEENQESLKKKHTQLESYVITDNFGLHTIMKLR